MVDVSIVIPVYNEEEAIGGTIDDIERVMGEGSYSFEIVIVDDGSDDETAAIVKGKDVRCCRHGKRKGVGSARNTGVRKARGKVIVMIDGDGTYSAGDIPALLDALGECDMVIGARRREAGTMPFLRTIAKNAIRRLASFITGEEIPDLNSGLRAFRREDALHFLHGLPSTHSWVSTITLSYLCNGLDVRYVPIDYFPRRGRSSFHPLFDTYNYLLLVVRTVLYFKPLKVFFPVALLLFALGIIRIAYDIVASRNIKDFSIMMIIVATLIGVLSILADLIVSGKEYRAVPRDKE